MKGAGKYDEACTSARAATKADGTILIVIGGEHGNGFSVQMPPQLVKDIPAMLRDVANQVEHDLWVSKN